MPERRSAPAPGERPSVPAGSLVVIVVSRGPAPAAESYISAPDLIGATPGTAHGALQEAGFDVRTFSAQGELSRGGRVIGQLPPPGVSVAAGSRAAILSSSPQRDRSAPTVALPDVVGMSEQEAVSVLHRAGLQVEPLYDYSSRFAEGVVAAQLPDPAAPVAAPPRRSPWPWVVAGVALLALLALLGVWLLGSRAEVPDVIGASRMQAEQGIEDAGLQVGTVREREAEDVEPGTVLEQSPNPGATVRRGSNVSLVVAAEDTDVAVPNVIRMAEREAVDALEAEGLEVEVTRAPSEAVEQGQVVRQTPGAGQVVPRGTTVGIVVSEGPRVENVAVPEVSGLTRQDAEEALTEAGLRIAVAESPSADVPSGVVITQMPAAGESVAPGTTIGIQVSTGPPPDDSQIEVPDLVGDPVATAERQLTQAGLQTLRVAVGGTGRPDNEVVAQSPAAGEQVAPNSTVVLFYSARE